MTNPVPVIEGVDAEPYDDTAEFFDVMATAHWETKRTVFESVLNSHAIRGPIIDGGAGTGISTGIIGHCCPDNSIHAIEPSRPMRTALMARIISSPTLRPRVTIHGESLQTAALPERIGAVALMGVVGHMSEPDRLSLWRRLRARMRPGAPIVVEYMAIDTPREVPKTTVADTVIGRRRYQVLLQGSPAGDLQRWVFTYAVSDRGAQSEKVLRHVEHLWDPISHSRLSSEVGPFGFRCEAVSPVMSVLTAC